MRQQFEQQLALLKKEVAEIRQTPAGELTGSSLDSSFGPPLAAQSFLDAIKKHPHFKHEFRRRFGHEAHFLQALERKDLQEPLTSLLNLVTSVLTRHKRKQSYPPCSDRDDVIASLATHNLQIAQLHQRLYEDIIHSEASDLQGSVRPRLSPGLVFQPAPRKES